MRRRSMLLAICLMLAFSGCQGNTLDTLDTFGKQGSTIKNVMSAEDTRSTVMERPASTETTLPAPRQSVNSEIAVPEKDVQSELTKQPVSNEAAPPAAGQDINQMSNGDMVEIKERMFIAQLNDVYLNEDDYLGKTIKYEGMFTSYTWEEAGMTYYLVYRQSPGCCGADGQAGFEVVWPDGSNKSYPNENDWCEVVGTLGAYEEDGNSYLHIILDSLTIKSERGAEFVSQ